LSGQWPEDLAMELALNLTGRLATAPCGHPGEHVIGQYVQCLIPGCSGLAAPRCDRCGSDRIEPFVSSGLPAGAVHCIPCGRVAWPGVEASDEG